MSALVKSPVSSRKELLNELFNKVDSERIRLTCECRRELEELRVFVELGQNGIESKVREVYPDCNIIEVISRLFIVLVASSVVGQARKSAGMIDYPILNAALKIHETKIFKKRDSRRHKTRLQITTDLAVQKLTSIMNQVSCDNLSMVPYHVKSSNVPESSCIELNCSSSSPLILFATSPNSAVSLFVLSELLERGVPISAVVSQKRFSRVAINNQIRYGFFSSMSRKLNFALRKLRRRFFFPEGFIEIKDIVNAKGLSGFNIRSYCMSRSIEYIEVDSFNNKECLRYVGKSKYAYGVYLGREIVREKLLDCFCEGVLHAHPAPIPEYRGMDCIEWALLQGDISGIGPSVQVLCPDLDAGPLVVHHVVDVSSYSSIEVVRSVVLFEMINTLINAVETIYKEGGHARVVDKTVGRQYFIMHSALKKVVEKRFKLGFASSSL